MTVAARITCETLPGLLRAFRTASDKSWGGGLGTRLGVYSWELGVLKSIKSGCGWELGAWSSKINQKWVWLGAGS